MSTLRLNSLWTVALPLILAASPVLGSNPCINEYPNAAGEILTSYGGRVFRIEPVEWFEDGVYRITVESGGVIMTKPGTLPMPQIGAELELRVFSKNRNLGPFASCYCQVESNICVEEYTYL